MLKHCIIYVPVSWLRKIYHKRGKKQKLRNKQKQKRNIMLQSMQRDFRAKLSSIRQRPFQSTTSCCLDFLRPSLPTTTGVSVPSDSNVKLVVCVCCVKIHTTLFILQIEDKKYQLHGLPPTISWISSFCFSEVINDLDAEMEITAIFLLYSLLSFLRNNSILGFTIDIVCFPRIRRCRN